MEPVGVECSFEPDGRVRVRRIQSGGQWLPVAQGRQWRDEAGRHVLIMLPDEQIEELILLAGELAWRLAPRRRSSAV